MFEGFEQHAIDLLWELRFNNNRQWFTEHKEQLRGEVLQPMKELADEVFAAMQEAFPKHGFIRKVSRLYKDARRVTNGEPYRDHLWFSIERPNEEWTAAPGFWFELSPEGFSCGMGFFMARALTMAKFRARIDASPKKFEKLIAPLDSQEEFRLQGDEYVRKKEAPSEKTATWYNKKSFSLVSEGVHGSEIFSPELVEKLVRNFTFLMPFYDYFVTLDSDADPRT